MTEKSKREKFKPRLCAEIFKALSNETRLQILLMLELRPRSVNEIVDFFTLSQPTISRHLHVLKKVRLVNVERQGQKKIYSLNESTLRDHGFAFFTMFQCCAPKSAKRSKA